MASYPWRGDPVRETNRRLRSLDANDRDLASKVCLSAGQPEGFFVLELRQEA
jgi:hypothetical protein